MRGAIARLLGRSAEPPSSSVPVTALADLMDDSADSDGQWNGADVCEALAALIERHGGWTRCPVDPSTVFSAAKSECPFPDHHHHHDDERSEDDDEATQARTTAPRARPPVRDPR